MIGILYSLALSRRSDQPDSQLIHLHLLTLAAVIANTEQQRRSVGPIRLNNIRAQTILRRERKVRDAKDEVSLIHVFGLQPGKFSINPPKRRRQTAVVGKTRQIRRTDRHKGSARVILILSAAAQCVVFQPDTGCELACGARIEAARTTL